MDPTFYDQLLTLPEAERNKVFESMDPKDLQGFLDHTAKAVPDEPVTIEEKAAPISWADRIKAKLANESPGAAQMVQQNNPNLDVQLLSPNAIPRPPKMGAPAGDPEGAFGDLLADSPPMPQDARIIARPKGEKGAWRPLDPDTGFFSDPKEFVKDATDLAYDLPAGAIQGLAQAAGGIAGAGLGAGGGPVGAFLGAKTGAGLAGGAVGTATDYARQGLAKLLGVPGDINHNEAIASGIGGFVAPWLFSTGATAGAAAKKGVTYASQRGLIGAGLRQGSATAGSLMSGVPKSIIERGREMLPQIKANEKLGLGVGAVLGEAEDEIQNGIRNQKDKLWHDIISTMSMAGGDGTPPKVNIKGVRGILEKQIKDLEATPAPAFTEDVAQELAALKDTYNGIFVPKTPAPLQEAIDAAKAKIAELTPKVRTSPELSQVANVELQKAQQQLTALQARVPVMQDAVDPMQALDLKKRLQNLSGFASKGNSPTRYKGMTAFDREVQLKGSEAMSALNDAIEETVKHVDNSFGTKGVQSLNERYKHARELEDLLKPFMDKRLTAEQAQEQLLMKISNNGTLRNTVSKMDKAYGTNVIDKADLVRGIRTFSRAPKTAQSGSGGTSTTRTLQAGLIGGGLATAAHAMGAPPELAYGLLPLGVAMGSTPAALRTYMNVGHLTGKVLDPIKHPFGLNLGIAPTVGSKSIRNAWLDMQSRP